MSIREHIARLLRDAPPTAEAVYMHGTWWTWGRLSGIASRLDALLGERGLGEGARVGIVLANTPQYLGLVLAVLSTGRCVTTFSPLQPAERLAADIDRAEVPVVVGAPETLGGPGVAEAAGRHGELLFIDADGELTAAAPSTGRRWPDSAFSPAIAVEMLTSGTTGPPKRVRLGYAQFDGSLRAMGRVPERDEDGRPRLRSGVSVLAAPLVHIGGLWHAVSNLYAGRRLVMLDRFRVDQWVDAVERFRPRVASLVPAALRSVLEAEVPPEKLSSLRAVTSGTAFCPPELAERFFRRYGVRVLPTYGATEFAGGVAAWSYDDHVRWWERKRGSVGRAMPGVSLRVTLPDGTPAPAGEVGLLEVRGGQLADGGRSWTRTSDLARLDEDGFLWIEGRADDAIIRGGFKVQPDVVRKALEDHPAVDEAVVFGRPDDRLGKVPVAVVTPREKEKPPTPDELFARCRETLTPYEVPVEIRVVDELPRTPSLKISRQALLELFEKTE